MEVRRSIDLDVDVERAWAALTEPDGLEAWLGGPSSLELAPGGLGVLRHDDGSVHLAEVEALEAGRRLVMRWVPATSLDGPATRVVLEVERAGDGSRVTVVETPLVAAAPDDDTKGWAQARAARWDARLAALESRLVAALR